MIKKVESVQYIVQDLQKNERYVGVLVHSFRQKAQWCTDKKKSYAHFGPGMGGEFTFNESAVSHKALCSKAEALLREERCCLVKTITHFFPKLFWFDLSIKRNAFEEEWYNNLNKIFPIAARLSLDEKVHITVTSIIFKTYICGWLGATPNCYLFQNKPTDEFF